MKTSTTTRTDMTTVVWCRRVLAFWQAWHGSSAGMPLAHGVRSTTEEEEAGCVLAGRRAFLPSGDVSLSATAFRHAYCLRTAFPLPLYVPPAYYNIPACSPYSLPSNFYLFLLCHLPAVPLP